MVLHNLGLAHAELGEVSSARRALIAAMGAAGFDATALLRGKEGSAVKVPAEAEGSLRALALRVLPAGREQLRALQAVAQLLRRSREGLFTTRAALLRSGVAAAGLPRAVVESRASECGTRMTAAVTSVRLGVPGASRAAMAALERCPCHAVGAVSALLGHSHPSEAAVVTERAGFAAALAWAGDRRTGIGRTVRRCAAGGALRRVACAATAKAAVGGFGFLAGYAGGNDVVVRGALAAAVRLVLPGADCADVAGWDPPSAGGGPRPGRAGSSSAGSSRLAALPQPPAVPGGAARAHVCFVTAFSDRHSVAKMSLHTMLGLDASAIRVSVVLVQGAGSSSDAVQALRQAAGDGVLSLEHLRDGRSPEEDAADVTALGCDAIVFPEVGMHARVVALAARRIAPVQVASHGHSVTSGFSDTVDFFVSLDGAETDGPGSSGAHGDGDGGWARYTEQLVRLRSAHSPFWEAPALVLDGTSARPVVEAADADEEEGFSSHHDAVVRRAGAKPVSAAELAGVSVVEVPEGASVTAVQLVAKGAVAALRRRMAVRTALPSGRVTVLVPQSVEKLSPRFDAVLLSVVLALPEGGVQLLLPDEREHAARVAHRLAAALAAALDGTPDAGAVSVEGSAGRALVVSHVLSYVTFVPQRGHTAFLRLLADADVVVDTHPFGGCTSSVEALLQGTPVLTLPAEHALAGRFTAALLRAAGRPEWVARSRDELVGLAVAEGARRALLRPGSRRMGRAVLSQAVRAVLLSPRGEQEWSAFLLRAVRSVAGGRAPPITAGAPAGVEMGSAPAGVAGWSAGVSLSAGAFVGGRRGVSARVEVRGPRADVGGIVVCVGAWGRVPACAALSDLDPTGPAEWRLDSDLFLSGACVAACSEGATRLDWACDCGTALRVDVAVLDMAAPQLLGTPLATASSALDASVGPE